MSLSITGIVAKSQNCLQDSSTDTEVKKLMSAHHLQQPEFDTKYDSDSDFDYRQKPPR